MICNLFEIRAHQRFASADIDPVVSGCPPRGQYARAQRLQRPIRQSHQVGQEKQRLPEFGNLYIR